MCSVAKQREDTLPSASAMLLQALTSVVANVVQQQGWETVQQKKQLSQLGKVKGCFSFFPAVSLCLCTASSCKEPSSCSQNSKLDPF